MKHQGFTIVELIVSVAIFAFMTAFVVAKYGTFNQSVLLTNAAYDLALTIRNAQTYGLNVKSRPTSDSAYTGGSTYDAIAQGYQYAYGMHFSDTSGQNTQMIFFAEPYGSANGKYDTGEKISTYTLRGGAYISGICYYVGNSPNCGANGVSYADVVFNRPDPEASFSFNSSDQDNSTAVAIVLQHPSGGTRKVKVERTGRITVLDE